MGIQSILKMLVGSFRDDGVVYGRGFMRLSDKALKMAEGTAMQKEETVTELLCAIRLLLEKILTELEKSKP